MAKRDNEGKWLPGHSGNPKGRPKGISITEMVKEALEEVEDKTGECWKDLIIKRILLKAVNEGDTQMLKAIWAYIDGMPKQRNVIEGDEERPLKIDISDMLKKAYDIKKES